MKIVVLAGGYSPERDVSLSSGCLIANELMDRGHQVLLLDLYLGIKNADTFDSAYTQTNRDKYTFQVPEHEPDLDELKMRANQGERLIGDNILAICKDADITFLALHGSMGENGQLQAVLDLYGVTYTGTGYAGSLLAMDKAVSKELLEYHGYRTPGWVHVTTLAHVAEQLQQAGISCPCVVKPCGCGSSVGVTMVDSMEALDGAVAAAKVYGQSLIVEEKITGREFSVGILNGEALPVIEIKPKQGFYDYKNKYQSDLTEEICPAVLSCQETEALQKLALGVHEALQLGDYSRVDFMQDKNGDFYCLEANTLPGMTPTSLLPQEAKAAGISYGDLCEQIIMLAAGKK